MSFSDCQPILDQVARIAGGGPTGGDLAGIYRGAGAITTGSKTIAVAYSSLRDVTEMQIDDIVHVCWCDEDLLDYGDGGDRVTCTHRIVVQVLLSMTRADFRTASRSLAPFRAAYFTAYAAKVQLNGTVASSQFRSRRGPLGVEPKYPNRHALEFVLEATEKAGVAFAA